MVAHRAVADAAGAGEVHREHAADRAPTGGAAEQRPGVHGLEGQHLPARRHHLLDVGAGRAGAGGEHQLLRLVEGDAREGGEVEGEVGLARPAEGLLGAVAAHFQRLAGAEGGADRLRDLLLVARCDDVAHDLGPG